MSQQMTMSFNGGMRVTAHYDGFEIATDQAVDDGGGASAPQPYDLFLASLATCAAFYVLRFCQMRDLSTDGILVTQTWQRVEGSKKMARISLRIEVPESFPAKYHQAVVRAADQCSVKKTLMDPPEITTELVVS